MVESDLETISNAIKESSDLRRKQQDDWFINNPLIKEFKIERETGYVQYGVWATDEDFLVFYKNSPDAKYSFRQKLVIEKEIIKELYPLLEL